MPAVLWFRPAIERRPIVVAGVAAVAFVGFYFSYPIFNAMFERFDINLYGRRAVWQAIFEKAHWGLGSSEMNAIHASGGTIQLPHSEYLRLCTDWTPLGAGIFIFLFAYLAVIAFGAYGVLALVAFFSLSFSDQGFLYVNSLVFPAILGLTFHTAERHVENATAASEASAAPKRALVSGATDAPRH
jgi:hypothetical protein